MPYLFAHFTGESPDGEQIYFAVSKDGLHWTDLHDGPILRSTVGECGVRDPFILRNSLNGEFVIMATDLRIASEKGWDVAQFAGSTSMVIWHSKDLLNWSEPDLHAFPEISSVRGTCLWAPETFFDVNAQNWLVYFACMIDRKQRVFSVRTTDFRNFSDFKLLIEKDSHVIDTTMAEEDGIYYRFSADGVSEGISMECSDTLDAETPTFITGNTAGLHHIEGPIIQYLDEYEGGSWCLYIDDIVNGGGYKPCVSKKLHAQNFEILPHEAYDFGNRRKRHGSMLKITEGEYSQLIEKYGVYEI